RSGPHATVLIQSTMTWYSKAQPLLNRTKTGLVENFGMKAEAPGGGQQIRSCCPAAGARTAELCHQLLGGANPKISQYNLQTGRSTHGAALFKVSGLEPYASGGPSHCSATFCAIAELINRVGSVSSGCGDDVAQPDERFHSLSGVVDEVL